MLRRCLATLWLVSAIACNGVTPQSGGAGASLSLELTPCQLQDPGQHQRLAAECGVYTVFEDRTARSGRTLDLRVAVVPAVRRDPAPDPLFFLTGGPGQAATESYVRVASAFRRVHQDRDVILVDQRGTGGSSSLRCPEPEDTGELWIFDEEQMALWVEDCLGGLDADPRHYTTATAMEDLDDVRDALGYDTINVYGISYGTRAALSYLRQFPERVRTLVLDGVVPPTEVLGLDVAQDAQRAFDLMVERCRRDADCRESFPDIAHDLDAVMARLSEPVPVTLRHPRTGEVETFQLHRSMAAFAVRLLSYSQETASLTPLLLQTAAEGDLEPLAAQFIITSDQLDQSISNAMGFSVACSEDFPFFDESAIAEANENTYLGAVQTDRLQKLCRHWPKGDIPSDFKEPVTVDVPTLVLSGEADPVTPPSNGELVASELPTALHIVAPGQGHMVVHRGCIPALVDQFIDDGHFEGLDLDCVDAIEARKPFVSFTGPTP